MQEFLDDVEPGQSLRAAISASRRHRHRGAGHARWVPFGLDLSRPNPRDGKTGRLCARLGRLAAMSTTETPPQTQTTPVASSAAAVPPELGAPPVDAASNGTGDQAADVSTDAVVSTDAATSAEPDEAGAATGAVGEKKRRGRRRKRKPGAQPGAAQVASEGGLSDHQPEQASDGAVTEGGAEAGAEGRHAEKLEREGPSRGPSPRDRKPEKKHRPQRERPPVNAGDIVFGKILDITDEAIIVDIPGKAHAIFDRREMLLADEDESARPRPTRSGSGVDVAPAEASEQPAGEHDAGDVSAANGTSPEQPIEPAEAPLHDG